jgi:hypothetical protein
MGMLCGGRAGAARAPVTPLGTEAPAVAVTTAGAATPTAAPVPAATSATATSASASASARRVPRACDVDRDVLPMVVAPAADSKVRRRRSHLRREDRCTRPNKRERRKRGQHGRSEQAWKRPREERKERRVV